MCINKTINLACDALWITESATLQCNTYRLHLLFFLFLTPKTWLWQKPDCECNRCTNKFSIFYLDWLLLETRVCCFGISPFPFVYSVICDVSQMLRNTIPISKTNRQRQQKHTRTRTIDADVNNSRLSLSLTSSSAYNSGLSSFLVGVVAVVVAGVGFAFAVIHLICYMLVLPSLCTILLDLVSSGC